MLLLPLLAACSGTPDDTATEAATVDFLSPTDGAVVAVGEVPVSLVVDGFTLVAAKHSEGAPEGYIAFSVDGAEVLQSAEALFNVAIDAAGEHVLRAELRYSDGDALEPAVAAEVTVTAE